MNKPILFKIQNNPLSSSCLLKPFLHLRSAHAILPSDLKTFTMSSELLLTQKYILKWSYSSHVLGACLSWNVPRITNFFRFFYVVFPRDSLIKGELMRSLSILTSAVFKVIDLLFQYSTNLQGFLVNFLQWKSVCMFQMSGIFISFVVRVVLFAFFTTNTIAHL